MLKVSDVICSFRDFLTKISPGDTPPKNSYIIDSKKSLVSNRNFRKHPPFLGASRWLASLRIDLPLGATEDRVCWGTLGKLFPLEGSS